MHIAAQQHDLLISLCTCSHSVLHKLLQRLQRCVAMQAGRRSAAQAGAGTGQARLHKPAQEGSSQVAQRKRKADATLDALAAQPAHASGQSFKKGQLLVAFRQIRSGQAHSYSSAVQRDVKAHLGTYDPPTAQSM